jgi:hypothetical protein
MIFSWRWGGSRPKRGCLLMLAYYKFPRWYEFGERRWNDILSGENRRTRRKTCPSATLSITNVTWIEPGAVRGRRLTSWAISRPFNLCYYRHADKNLNKVFTCDAASFIKNETSTTGGTSRNSRQYSGLGYKFSRQAWKDSKRRRQIVSTSNKRSRLWV